MPRSELMASWQLWAGLASLFAALTAVLAKLGVAAIPSNLATFLRTLVVVAVLAALLLARGELVWDQVTGLERRSLVALVLSGLATGASWLCYFRALQLGPVARVASIDKFSVVLVALFGVLALGESLTPRAWLGVLLMGGGAVLVALP
ncbi:MAG: EamA family transporter [Synechococcus sp.]